PPAPVVAVPAPPAPVETLQMKTCEAAEEHSDGRVASGDSIGKPVSGGILNGKAIRKPAPAYPAAARAAGATGQVVVQITVDECGVVEKAAAVSGHPLLREAAADAAYESVFSPTRLSGRPVKVTGTITYNFVLQ
ncbi:MAG TPA: TonB family protein, partial [Pyrinomonadaceae bacterium]